MLMRPLAIALLLAGPLAANDVWVVDASGGGDFLDVAPALAVAQDGDVLLVRSGAYGGFSVVDLDVSIVAEAGAEATTGPARVLALDAARTVVLSGLTIHGDVDDPGTEGAAVDLVGCGGPVRLEGITALGDGAHRTLRGGPALRVDGCSDVLVAASRLFGGDSNQDGTYHHPGTPRGVFATDAVLTLYETEIDGGTGLPEADHDGGHGVELHAGTLFVAGGRIRGGDASNTSFPPCGETDGGDGILLGDASEAWLLDVDLDGGGYGCCDGLGTFCGFDGMPYRLVEGSTLSELPFALPRFAVDAHATTESSVTLTFEGEPGDDVWLRWGGHAGYDLRLEWNGVVGIAEPWSLLFVKEGNGLAGSGMVIDVRRSYLGKMNAQGEKVITIQTKDFPPGTEGRTVHLQGIVVDGLGNRTLSRPAAVSVTD